MIGDWVMIKSDLSSCDYWVTLQTCALQRHLDRMGYRTVVVDDGGAAHEGWECVRPSSGGRRLSLPWVPGGILHRFGLRKMSFAGFVSAYMHDVVSGGDCRRYPQAAVVMAVSGDGCHVCAGMLENALHELMSHHISSFTTDDFLMIAGDRPLLETGYVLLCGYDDAGGAADAVSKARAAYDSPIVGVANGRLSRRLCDKSLEDVGPAGLLNLMRYAKEVFASERFEPLVHPAG